MVVYAQPLPPDFFDQGMPPIVPFVPKPSPELEKQKFELEKQKLAIEKYRAEQQAKVQTIGTLFQGISSLGQSAAGIIAALKGNMTAKTQQMISQPSPWMRPPQVQVPSVTVRPQVQPQPKPQPKPSRPTPTKVQPAKLPYEERRAQELMALRKQKVPSVSEQKKGFALPTNVLLLLAVAALGLGGLFLLGKSYR